MAWSNHSVCSPISCLSNFPFLGKKLKISDNILKRHPFPGPGLAIRILGGINEEKVKILQDADEIFISELISNNLYDKIWQAGVILLPIKSTITS